MNNTNDLNFLNLDNTYITNENQLILGIKKRINISNFKTSILLLFLLIIGFLKSINFEFIILFVIIFSLIWIYFIKSTFEDNIFAVFLFLPASHLLFSVLGFSLSIIDLFILFSIFNLKKQIFKFNNIIFILLLLCFVCFVSFFLSNLIEYAFGMLIRYFLMLIFLICLLSIKPNLKIFSAILSGLILIPFSAVLDYFGQGFLFSSIIANILIGGRGVLSQFYPIWISFTLIYLSFFKKNNILIYLFIVFLLFLIITSYSRAVVISSFIFSVIYILFWKKENKNIKYKKTFTFLIVLIGFIILTNSSLFMTLAPDPNGDLGESNQLRYYKMALALNLWLNNLFFGAGFGYSSMSIWFPDTDVDLAYAASAEFGPLNILAEIGVFGLIIYLIYISISFYCTLTLIRNKKNISFIKYSTLLSFISFFNTFLIGNILHAQIILPLLTIPILFYRYNNIYFK